MDQRAGALPSEDLQQHRVRHAAVEDHRGVHARLDRVHAGLDLGDHPARDRPVGLERGDAGGSAVGISGKDARLVIAEQVRRTEPDPNSGIERHVDLGFVGEPVTVDPTILTTLAAKGFIPVVAPVALGKDGATYNINADTMAGSIAAACQASRFFLLTDVAGVLDKSGELQTDLDPARVEALKADGTIKGGMIPKMETCVAAVREGVEAAVIIDGRVPHAMLLEIFTDSGVGTLVHR